MGVSLIRRLAEDLSARGFVALRFNFGGVGLSGGSFTDGAEEPGDVAAAVKYLKALDEVDFQRVHLAGWSFGSWMALMALAEGVEVMNCVCIAPPLIAYDWRLQAERIATSGVGRCYIVGDGDQFCSVADLREFTSKISPEDAAGVTVLPGADHFLFGRESEVIGLVADRLFPPP
jgi:alpha/beta superfamily hydrolase